MLEVDRVIGPAADFGARIRQTIMAGDELNYKWSQIAMRVFTTSPGTVNTTAMIAVLCQLCATDLFIQDAIKAE